jgi:hypothetical protein
VRHVNLTYELHSARGWSLATGEVGFSPINIQFAAAALTRAGPVAPWILTFGLPVGAIAALLRYRRWSGSALVAASPDPSAPQAAI